MKAPKKQRFPSPSSAQNRATDFGRSKSSRRRFNPRPTPRAAPAATALRAHLRQPYSPTADPSIPATLAVEMLPLAMRGVYLTQTCVADPAYEKKLFAALASPRPSVISLLCPIPNEAVTTYYRRAEHAVRSRAFPLCVYDPDRDRHFVNCLDLSDNPTPEDAWAAPIGAIETVDHAHNEPAPAYTFAHFAAEEAAFADEFTAPDEAQRSHFTPLADYLELNRRQRVGRIPIVKLRDDSGEEVERAVSATLVTQASDRLHLWTTLQEIAGVNNPQIQSTRTSLQSAFGVRQKALLESLKAEMESASKRREKAAIAQAVRKLVAHLTGVDGAHIDLSAMLEEPAPASPAPTSDN